MKLYAKIHFRIWLWLLPVVAGIYSVYSFSQTDPNQVFFSQSWYWQFQKFMWRLGFQERLWSVGIYSLIILIWFIVYQKIYTAFVAGQLLNRHIIRSLIFTIGLLLLANPALSSDIYNYIFNAKMVWVYGANPHRQVALNFPDDQWLRFMHNTHTPAPYGYGWTMLSLVPSVIGQNHLKLTLLLVKMFVGAFFAGVIFFQSKIGKLLAATKWREGIVLFALNPLVLIETFGNGHNDVVMMALALASIYLALRASRQKGLLLWGASGLFFLASYSIKYGSIAILVGVGLWYALSLLKKKFSLGGALAIAQFSPLLTIRSQRFLPWYLIWPLSFIPFISERWLVKLALFFSLSSLLSYLPHLYRGEYTIEVQRLRQLITFGLPIILILFEWMKKVDWLGLKLK